LPAEQQEASFVAELGQEGTENQQERISAYTVVYRYDTRKNQNPPPHWRQ
jgi:hypothetical protein